MFELVKEGKVFNVLFGVYIGDIEEIEKVWGKVNKIEYIGNGMYVIFINKNVVFGFNKGL